MRGDLCEGIVTIKIEEGNQRAVSLNQKSQFGKLSEELFPLIKKANSVNCPRIA